LLFVSPGSRPIRSLVSTARRARGSLAPGSRGGFRRSPGNSSAFTGSPSRPTALDVLGIVGDRDPDDDVLRDDAASHPVAALELDGRAHEQFGAAADVRKMDEELAPAVVGRDETITLADVDPFDSSK